MTNSRIQSFPFDKKAVEVWSQADSKYSNWPVVYTILNEKEIYVGETSNASLRMNQHLSSLQKSSLRHVNVIVHDDFNKSACLDLESYLIRFFAADDKFTVLNGNNGITDSDYFQRDKYRESFNEIYEELREAGVFTRSIPDIVNSDLFKYSPYKALNTGQAIAIEGILENLFEDENEAQKSSIVVQGEPGTGKTIVAIYLMKLLADIKNSHEGDVRDIDNLFSDFFQEGFREKLLDLKFALVVPQISLRKTVSKVFSKTPGLSKDMVLSAFDLRKIEEPFDLLIVDETHRLQQRANQSSASNNKLYAEINVKFFGQDNKSLTQLDWIKAASKSQIFLLDEAQTVKPADLPEPVVNELIRHARSSHDFFKLSSQMRVAGGDDYIAFITQLFSNNPPELGSSFFNYEFGMFDDLGRMWDRIRSRDEEFSLARILAGYAWPWSSKGGKASFDYEIDGIKCLWNSTDQDWLNSPKSLSEVGSIHTIQGYDLNFAGVIIGPELGYDPELKKFVFYRENYHDKKGKENNPALGKSYSDAELLSYVLNIYRVLATRGIKGTYLYAVDIHLRDYLKRYLPTIS